MRGTCQRRVAWLLLPALMNAALAAAAPAAPRFHSVPLSRKRTLGSSSTLRRLATAAPGSNGSASVPTGGNVWPVAIYWITVLVGTPPVPFPVAIDSGSMTLDIQGPGCKNCPKFAPNRAYDPEASSTSKPCSLLTCRTPKTFSNTYQTCDLSNPDAPCTIKGNNYEDMVSIGRLGPVPVTFGAITTQVQRVAVCGHFFAVGFDLFVSDCTHRPPTLINSSKSMELWA